MAWNRSGVEQSSTAETRKSRPKSGRFPVLIGVVAIMLCAGVAVFVCSEASKDQPASRMRTKSVVEPKKDRAMAPAQKPPVRGRSKERTAETTTSGTSTTAVSAPAVEVGTADSNAVAKAKKPHVFASVSDQLIAMATTIPDGGFIPPLPVTESDTDAFIESYRKPLEIAPDDSEKIRELKTHINAVREEIAGMIAQNPELSLSEILNAHRDRFNGNSEMHAEAKAQYDRLVEEGDAEVAETYRRKANEVLQQTGAEEIKRDGEDVDEDDK